jgi:type IV fimbrial biogenesis protein FimT
MEGRMAGFTLLELFICISLMSMAMLWGAPLLDKAGQSGEARQFGFILARALNLARGRAVASGEWVTLCASSDQHSCRKNWLGEVYILVFTDRDRNFQFGGQDTLHLSQRLVLRHGSAYWRGSLGRPYMRYRVDGSAVEYGRYSYCPQSGEAREFRQLVINRVGRAYLHYDGSGRTSVCQ